MHEPNIVGDWQEYDDEHPGLRVRVHDLKKDEPPRGRDDHAKDLTYFSFRVTVENRSGESIALQLEDGQLDVRIGGDGEGAFLDWRNSQFIEGFDVYPLRRATATIFAAGPEDQLEIVDVQVQLRADEEWTRRCVWVGGIGVPQPSACGGKRPGAAKDSIAAQVSRYLEGETGTA
ncbi:hypothetical protein [Streptomyces jeddahensis]|uniref:Uncharacterized protein n=1 Tax=Streptomyces jeddahensis TaxID=1716141 RepID=A0A177HNX9_9ACTN|nr:hypothetical protein [Streptomyces jeddahensis]OAH12625.1 hypothetical protein STSP_39710 [Streptomyces jeddahensis]